MPLLRKAKHGHIVNLGSIAGFETYKGGAGYAAARTLHRTLDVKRLLPDAAGTLAQTFGAQMIPAEYTAKVGYPGLAKNPVGTGPYKFVEWVKDDHLLILRNDNYWNKQGGPYLDRVRYRPIPDDTVKLQSLQGGELDVRITLRDGRVLAADLGIDPVAIRLRNLPAPDSKTVNWLRITSCGLEECINKVVEASRFLDRRKSMPPGRGLGFAVSSYLSGAGTAIYWNDMPHSGPLRPRLRNPFRFSAPVACRQPSSFS